MELNLDKIKNMIDIMPGNNVVYKVVGEKLSCVHFSKDLPKLSGYTDAEYKAFTDPFNLIIAEDQIVIRDKARAFLHDKKVSGEDFIFRLSHKTLGFIWVHMAVKLLGELDGAPYFIASIVDVTKEMQNSEVLLEATERCICVIEKSTKRFLYANTPFYELIDSTPAESMGKHCYELLCKNLDMSNNDNCLCYSCINAAAPIEYYNPVKKMHISMTGRPIVWGEYDAYVFFLTDITKDKEMDALLEDSQKRFNVALDNSDIMIWEYDMVNNRCINSEKAGRDYNIPIVIENYPESLFTTGHTPPETIEQIKDVKRRLENGETGFSVERRTVDKYGKSNWQKVDYSLECDENGKPIRAIVCGLDITAQKELEKKYEEQVAYRNSLAAKAMFSIRLDLTDDTITDYTCGEKALLPVMDGVHTATEYVNKFFSTSIFDSDSGITQEKLMPEALKKYYSLGHNKYTTVYQCTALNKYISMDLSISENPSNKHLEAFFLIVDATANALMQTAFRSVVGKDYDFIASINVINGIITFPAHSGSETIAQNMQYDEVITGFANRHKDEYNTHEDYLSVSSDMVLSKIIEKLEKMPVYEFNCKTKTDTYRLSFTYADNLKRNIIFTRANISAAVHEEQETQKKLEAALDAAKRANNAKTDFLSRMSHDMRTPMNGILGITALLHDRTDPEEISEDVNQIEMSGKYLLSLINDTLDMSKIEAGRMELRPQPINSESLFSNILTTTHILASSKGVHLNVDFPQIEHGKWMSVVADAARVEQIFINIISNAIKFTPVGGTVTLHMENLVTTDDKVTDKYVITDTGIGMSKEFQKHLFEPFSQEGRSNTNRESGTGLGLAIVKQLLDLMGGSVDVKSKVDEGTTVTIILNYKRYHGDVKFNAAQNIDFSVLKNKHVLLCEDHPVNAQITRRLLEKHGVIITHAEDGLQALEAFKQSDEGFFDAVLMDIRMPVMDGIDATKAIRGLTDRKDAATVPIIALTANAFDNDVQQYLDAGMDAHLAKPIEADKLYATIAKYVAK